MNSDIEVPTHPILTVKYGFNAKEEKWNVSSPTHTDVPSGLRQIRAQQANFCVDDAFYGIGRRI